MLQFENILVLVELLNYEQRIFYQLLSVNFRANI